MNRISTQQLARLTPALVLLAAAAMTIGCSDNQGSDASADPLDGSAGSAGHSMADSGADTGADVNTDTGADSATSNPSRQSLRDKSLFKNGSFEETSQADSTLPSNWTCSYTGTGTPPDKPCVVKSAGSDGVHGKHYLELQPQSAAFQDVTTFDQAKHVMFDLFMRRNTGVSASDVFLGVVTSTDTFYLDGRTVDESVQHPGWSHVSSLSHPLADATQLRIIILNSSTTEVMSVDDLVGVERDKALDVTGHLLRAEHGNQIDCSPGGPTTVWVPLPLDHGVQVPLYVALDVTPSDAAEATKYEVDAEGNLGALVTFKKSSEALSAKLTWTGVVLSREVSEQDLPALYPERTKANTWLTSTPVVDTTNAGLKAAATQAVQGASTPEQKMGAVLAWTSTYLDPNNPYPTSLDAVSAFNAKSGSCTSYANLASAAGRIAGVPTRSVANYLVGAAQQTHSISEFYLGSQLGWRLVEPQGTKTSLPADYAVLVHINMPTDEGSVAMAGNHNWSAPGVPSRSLVHPVTGELSRCHYGYPSPPVFPECPTCDNKAVYQGTLLGSRSKVADLWSRSRTLWQATLTKMTSSGVDTTEQKKREAALDVRDLAGLEQLVKTLE